MLAGILIYTFCSSLKEGAMHKRLTSFFIISLFTILINITSAQAATSGAFNLFGSDAEALGKGNAFTGEADNPAAVYFNPAGTSQLKDGIHLSIGTAVMRPQVTHTGTSGVKTQMRQHTFFLPEVYAVSNVGTEKFHFGFGVKTNFGAGTDWAPESFSKYVATKTELQTVDYSLIGAYQVNDQLSIGVGFDAVDSSLAETKSINQSSNTDGQAQIKGSDMGYGYSLSTLYKLNDQHQFGLIYRSAVELNLRGKVHLDSLSSSGSNLAGIFLGTSYTTAAKGNLELPQSVALGYSFRPNDKWTFNFDTEWMDWSSIEQQNFDFPDVNSSTQQYILNSSSDLPLDWKSTVSYGIGTEYAYSDRLRFRAGYAYNPSPIPKANFHTFLPDADSHNVSIGVGWNINENMVLDATYMALMFQDRKITNNVGAAVGASINGKYEEWINFGMLTLSYNF